VLLFGDLAHRKGFSGRAPHKTVLVSFLQLHHPLKKRLRSVALRFNFPAHLAHFFNDIILMHTIPPSVVMSEAERHTIA
jgi:hypothetical protein